MFVIVWSIWKYRNNVIFKNFDAQPAYTITLAVKLFDGMRSIMLCLESLFRR